MIRTLANYLYTKFSLRRGKETSTQTILQAQANSSIEGANLWILLLAVIICSIGLNLNSTAIVIGAMLISPIMGPIVGIGVGLAIYDTDMVRHGLKNFGIACLLAIIVSGLYFFITPFEGVTTEILLRTSPSLRDIVIAIAGGTVGAIALTRKDKGYTIIPGVAIATALMPPLCVSGYWLIEGEFIIALKAFYLLFINITYIAGATFLVSRLLRLPKKQYPLQAQRRKVQSIISLVIVIVAIPGIILTQNLLKQQFVDQQFSQFTQKITKKYPLQILQKVINTEKKTIGLRVVGSYLSMDEQQALQEHLNSYYDLKDYVLTIRQGIDTNPNLGEELVQPLLTQALQTQEQQTIALIQQSLQEYSSKLFVPERVVQELQLLDENISSIEFQYATMTEGTGDLLGTGEVILTGEITTNEKSSLTITIHTKEQLPDTQQKKIEEWIRIRTQDPDAIISWKIDQEEVIPT